MQRCLAGGLALLIVACCDIVRVDACGDKFLLIGRAVKYQQAYTSAHPGSIVFFESPDSRLVSVARQLNLQQLLVGAGHRVQVISDLPSLEQAMKTGTDLIVVDLNDIPQIAAAVQGRRTGLLPVLDHPTREGLAAAERTYGVVLQASAKNRHPLAVVDDALKLRSKKGASKS
jgi:hypothetical protein